MCFRWQTVSFQVMITGWFRIRGGACDVDMRRTVLDNNSQSGLNITYSGGRRILQNVKTRSNRGIGMYIDYIHEYKTREERHQKSELIAVTIEVCGAYM